MTDAPKLARCSLSKAVESLLEVGARSATVVQHPKLTVTATRRHRPNRRAPYTTILLTIGRPNFRWRKFIKDCQKAGEPFPVKKVQLTFYPKRGGR